MRNLILRPTIERRGGKVIPTHRWKRPPKAPEEVRRLINARFFPQGSMEEAQRALNALAVRRGVPGWVLGARRLPQTLRGLGDHVLWKVLAETPIVIGGSHPHYNHRSRRIYIPSRVPILTRIFDGVRTPEEWIRKHIPYAAGREGELVVLHEAMHALDYYLGEGESLWALRVRWKPSRKLARKVHKRWEYAAVDPREVPVLAVEMAVYSPEDYEVFRRLALEEGVDLEGLMALHYRIDMSKIKGAYDEERVRARVCAIRGEC